MGRINATINETDYSFSCGEGQEEHLQRLCGHMNERLKELSESLGSVPENELLVFAGILISDELSDAYAEIDRLKRALIEAERTKPQDNTQIAMPLSNAEKDKVEDSLKFIATRLERLVERVT